MSELESLGGVVKELLKDTVKTTITSEIIEEVKGLVQEDILKKYGPLPQIIELRKEGEEPRVFTGTFHEAFPTVVKLVELDLPVYLSGPAGSGK